MPENWELFKIFADNAIVSGDLATAENYLWQAIEVAAESQSRLKLALCMDSLGDLYYRMHRFSEAESVYSDCLEKQIEALGLEHPEIAHTLNKLSTCQSFQNKLKEAEDSLKQALLVNLICHGQSAPPTLVTINNLKSIYSRQGKVFDMREIESWGALPPSEEPKEELICKTCHRPYTGYQCAACTQVRMTAMKVDELERLKVVCAVRDIRPGTIITLSAVHTDYRMVNKFDAFFDTKHVVGKSAVRLIPQGSALKMNDVDW